jgi:hypothetical protein
MASDPAAAGGLALCAAGAVCSYLAWRAGREAAALLGARRPARLADLAADAAAGALPALVALRGVVGCAAPLTCVLPAEGHEGGAAGDDSGGDAAQKATTRSIACVLHETVVRSVYLARSWWASPDEPWAERSRVVSRTLREAPFFLRDGSGARVWILGAATAAGGGGGGGALALVHDAFVPAPRPGLLRALLALLRGYEPLGTRTRERVLPVGTRLTAVGEALTLDGALRLRRPLAGGGPFYVCEATLEELVARLRARQRTLRAAAAGLAALGGALLLRRARAAARRGAGAAGAARREAQRQARLEAEAVAQQEAAGASDGQCVVCYDRPQSCVFPRCGHLACCAACAARLSACPVCRAPGTATRVYRC